MKKKLLTVLIGLTLVLLLVFGSLPGCGGAPTPTTTVPPGGEVPGVMKWRWQHNLPATDPVYGLALDLVSDLKIASAGRLDIEVLPAGTAVANTDILDAVGKGTVDVGTSDDAQWGEKDPVFYLIGNIAGGMTFGEIQAWMADREYSAVNNYAVPTYAKYGVRYLLWDFGPPEQEYSASKPLANIKDYKGTKIRATGWTAKVLKEPEFGAVVSEEKEADVYAALEKGSLDAAVVGTPYVNSSLNLQKVAKYAGFPGMGRLARLGSLLVNQAKWDSLPDDIKRMFEQFCYEKAQTNYAWKVDNDAKVFNELQKAGNVVIQDVDTQNVWVNVSWRLGDKVAETNADFKKVWVEYKRVVSILRPYIKLQTPNYDDIPARELEVMTDAQALAYK